MIKAIFYFVIGYLLGCFIFWHPIFGQTTASGTATVTIPANTFLVPANNLSDVVDKAAARTNLGITNTGTTVQVADPLVYDATTNTISLKMCGEGKVLAVINASWQCSSISFLLAYHPPPEGCSTVIAKGAKGEDVPRTACGEVKNDESVFNVPLDPEFIQKPSKPNCESGECPPAS